MREVPVLSQVSIAPFAGAAAVGLDIAESARCAVERLIHTYSYSWDSRDAAATASLFVEDAEVAFFLDGAQEPTHRTVGRVRLLEDMTARTEMLRKWRVETRHLMVNTVFGPAGVDELEAVTTAVVFWQQLPEHPAPTAVQTGYYRSWCVETDAGWRFRRLETHMSGILHPKQLYATPH